MACGNTMRVKTRQNGNPRDRAASAWPKGTVLKPERSVSHTKVAVYKENPRTDSQKLLFLMKLEFSGASAIPRF
ncbi:Uncharacterised protein [Mycobacteroides abscessus subsp. massiliense]|nr:Uncharacterised protein [Mycobacteroides abscessus subsp. massiliense]